MLSRFRRSRKSDAATAPVDPDPGKYVRDPLGAVPRFIDGVQWKVDRAGLVFIRRELPARGRIDAWLINLFRSARTLELELDERGSYYWQQIDGKRDLHAIAALLQTQYGLTLDDARMAAIEFTRALMLRNFVQLELATPTA